MMMMKVNLPLDLIEEILSRVPISFLKSLKLTCKEWNALSRDLIFKEKHCRKAAKEIMMIMVDGFKLRLLNINLHGIDNHFDLVDPFINYNKIYQVFHCDGLLLCVYKSKFNSPGLMVWNPYLSQFREIQAAKPRHAFEHYNYIYVMGYDNNNHHKILRFCNNIFPSTYGIYDFMSNSWRRLDLILRCTRNCGVSFKGNNYFIDGLDNCLRCFDFTRETIEKGLPLPYDSNPPEFVGLSLVKEEQLALLMCDSVSKTTQIWITTKIEPTAVSWRFLFKVDYMKFPYGFKSFYVEEKKKVAVICIAGLMRHKVCMIKEDGYYKELYRGSFYKISREMRTCSYVPSLMWIL